VLALQVVVVSVPMPCSDVVGLQRFAGPARSQSRRPRLESSSPWKPQILHYFFTDGGRTPPLQTSKAN